MYEHVGQIWWSVSVVMTVVFVAGSKLETIPECINCQNEHTLQPELDEYIKSQKIAHRLEYIKKQLLNTLHMKNISEEPPKFNSLPDFLVQKLIHEDSSKPAFTQDIIEDQTSRKMVLFVEHESITCDSSTKGVVCLHFRLSDDVFSSDSSSAIVWFHRNSLPVHGRGMQNFTITDTTLLMAKNRNVKAITSNYVTDIDGWYQIDVTVLVKSWRSSKANKRRILRVTCNSCTRGDYSTDATSLNANKTSFLFLNINSDESARSKRGADCVSGKEECCREDLWVDFNILGAGFSNVMNPPKFNAYGCRGTCHLSDSIDYNKPYSQVKGTLNSKNQTQYRIPTTCCTPTRFSDMPVVFYSDTFAIQRYSVPNVVIESCGCI